MNVQHKAAVLIT